MNEIESSICGDLLNQIKDTKSSERYQAMQEYKTFLEAVLLRRTISANPE